MDCFDELHLFTIKLPLAFFPRISAEKVRNMRRDSVINTAQHWVSKLYGEDRKFILKIGDGDMCAIAKLSGTTFLDSDTQATDTLIVAASVVDVDRKTIRQLIDEIRGQITAEEWVQFRTRTTYSF